MRRGTTPTHIFKLPFDVDTIKTIKIIYKQERRYPLSNIVIVKTKKDCKLNEKSISVTLSQDDTLSFDHNSDDFPVNIQLRVLTESNTSLVSNIIVRHVEPCLDNEVLT